MSKVIITTTTKFSNDLHKCKYKPITLTFPLLHV